MNYAISGRFALDVADGGVLQEFVTTAGHTATGRKAQKKKNRLFMLDNE